MNVDICPECKGVWLDRGELEKIVELVANGGPNPEMRSEQARGQHLSEESRRQSEDRDDEHDYREKRDRDHDYDERSHQQGYGQRKKKSSWLGDILGGIGGED